MPTGHQNKRQHRRLGLVIIWDRKTMYPDVFSWCLNFQSVKWHWPFDHLTLSCRFGPWKMFGIHCILSRKLFRYIFFLRDCKHMKDNGRCDPCVLRIPCFFRSFFLKITFWSQTCSSWHWSSPRGDRIQLLFAVGPHDRWDGSDVQFGIFWAIRPSFWPQDHCLCW